LYVCAFIYAKCAAAAKCAAVVVGFLVCEQHLVFVFAAIGAAVFSVGVGDCSRTFWDCFFGLFSYSCEGCICV